MAVKNKSYLNNPALQFISSALVDEATDSEKPAQVAVGPDGSRPEGSRPDGSGLDGSRLDRSRPDGYSAKSSPAKPAASTKPAKPKASAPAKAPETPFEVPMKPVYVEVRSKRFNALMQPTLYRNLTRLALEEGVSVNELMHRALEAYVAERMAE